MNSKALLVIIGIIFVCLAFASVEASTLKKYDRDTATITLEENTKDIVSIRLIENTDQCLINCYSILAITPQENFQFQDLLFRGIGEESLDINYKFYVFERVYVPYEEKYPIMDCFTHSNGTRECEQKGVNTIRKWKWEWTWNPKPITYKLSPGKTYYVKIEGKKNSIQRVDWILKTKNVELSEWAWWDNDWVRKRPINISTASGTERQGMQYYLNITYDGYMQNDFDDIRFTNGSENTELDYWIENKTDSSWATIWIEIDVNITTTNETIYMYYQNPGASAGSNGNTTFTFFDDFTGDAYNTTNWIRFGCANIDVLGGSLSLVPNNNGTECKLVTTSLYPDTNDTIMRAGVTINNGSNVDGRSGIGVRVDNVTIIGYQWVFHDFGNEDEISHLHDTVDWGHNPYAWNKNQYYSIENYHNGTELRGRVNDGSWYTQSGGAWDALPNNYWDLFGGAFDENITYYWTLVRYENQSSYSYYIGDEEINPNPERNITEHNLSYNSEAFDTDNE
ncbi:MAG: DUF2341 domain-containing protein, partial [archaeon]